ncbi:carbohydrate porin [Vibrio mediterranei]
MKYLKINTPLLVSSLTLIFSHNSLAQDVDFSSYFRAGAGSSSSSGAMVSYNKQKVGRLGNEDDIYLGLGLGTQLMKTEQHDVYFQTRMVYKSDGANDWESINDSDTDIMFKEVNVAVKGLITALPDTTVWAGKRYNQRHDNHIIDTYYWNVSGTGGGIDYIPLGDGLLSVSAIRSDRKSQNFDDPGTVNNKLNVNILDARYKGINLWDMAELEVGLDYGMPNESDEFTLQTQNGLMATGLMTSGGKWGKNNTVFQYGTNGFSKALFNDHAGKNYYAEVQKDASAYRVMNYGLLNISDSVVIAHSLYYTSSINDIERDQTTTQKTFSAVARPEYHWDDFNKTIMEIGYFDATTAQGEDQAGSKITLAQAWAPSKSFWARPELRVFATYFHDYENQNAFGTGNDTEFQVGIQVEGWFK